MPILSNRYKLIALPHAESIDHTGSQVKISRFLDIFE